MYIDRAYICTHKIQVFVCDECGNHHVHQIGSHHAVLNKIHQDCGKCSQCGSAMAISIYFYVSIKLILMEMGQYG